jgi:hypothetical protein
MKMKPVVSFMMGLALVCGASMPVLAGPVIFSNLGPGDSYGDSGLSLGASPSGLLHIRICFHSDCDSESRHNRGGCGVGNGH